MFQTGYKGINGFSSRLPYDGGFCKFWLIAKENIAAFPAIDPATQYLSAEPTLKAATNWIGPFRVPNSELGFEEAQQVGKAGIFYKQKVSGFHVGDSGTSRVNLENMPYYEYVIAGKLRAGGLYLLLGNNTNGLDYLQTFTTGPGSKAAGTQFTFQAESLNKGLILPAFSGDNVTPPPDYVSDPGGVIGIDTNLYEIITFTTETEKTFAWTTERIAKFGVFPEIQVWSTAGAVPVLINVAIDADHPPPSATLFTVYTPGTPGFIVIK